MVLWGSGSLLYRRQLGLELNTYSRLDGVAGGGGGRCADIGGACEGGLVADLRWPLHYNIGGVWLSECSGPRRSWGGDGGAETAGQATVSEALHFRSGDADSCLGTPQEWDRRQKTRDSPQADKACKRGGVASSGGRNSRETAKQAAGTTRAATTRARLPTTPEVHTDPREMPQRDEVPPTAGRRAPPERQAEPLGDGAERRVRQENTVAGRGTTSPPLPKDNKTPPLVHHNKSASSSPPYKTANIKESNGRGERVKQQERQSARWEN
ncbi:hypothetical protein NDU88_006659 [Pleurodeles waltl]|uniref:Uncharacterized protein n=1 Tax=Pleurodeles waltl TaxID=8319 RepID=A0AAV7NYQ4_PLEWA|nr:hypothetical protein NDU88_006659 [Pleurodeles waltl]